MAGPGSRRPGPLALRGIRFRLLKVLHDLNIPYHLNSQGLGYLGLDNAGSVVSTISQVEGFSCRSCELAFGLRLRDGS